MIDKSDQFNPGSSRNLDILRLIAVALVVQDHLVTFWGNPTYLGGAIYPSRLGRFGVVLFFVHTALVLMASMDRQWARTGRHRFVTIFLIRRGFRIFPLAVVALFVTLIFNIPGQSQIGGYTHVPYDARNVFANLFLVQNVAGGVYSSILSPMWSLSFEWQMYLALPLFYFLFRRTTSIIPLLLIGTAPFLVLLSYAVQIDRFNRGQAFWKIPDWGIYGPCFIAGIIAFFVSSKLPPARSLGWWALPVLIAALFVPVMATGSHYKFVPASFMVALIIPTCREIRMGWFSAFAHVIVRYSYCIYLFHLIGIWLAFVRLAREPVALRWLVFALFFTIVPVVIYHLLEHPAISLGNRLARRMEIQAPPHDHGDLREPRSLDAASVRV